MKKAELLQIIREEVGNILKEAKISKRRKPYKNQSPPFSIVIFGPVGCGGCVNMKNMLESFSIKVKEKKLNDSEKDNKLMTNIKRRLIKLGKIKKGEPLYFPIITVIKNGKYVSTELMPAIAQGHFRHDKWYIREINPETRKILCGSITGTFKKCSNSKLVRFWDI